MIVAAGIDSIIISVLQTIVTWIGNIILAGITIIFSVFSALANSVFSADLLDTIGNTLTTFLNFKEEMIAVGIGILILIFAFQAMKLMVLGPKAQDTPTGLALGVCIGTGAVFASYDVFNRLLYGKFYKGMFLPLISNLSFIGFNLSNFQLNLKKVGNAIKSQNLNFAWSNATLDGMTEFFEFLGGLVALILAIFVLFYVFKQLAARIMTMLILTVKRALLIRLYIHLSPMPMGTLVSNSTKQIAGNYLRMILGEMVNFALTLIIGRSTFGLLGNSFGIAATKIAGFEGTLADVPTLVSGITVLFIGVALADIMLNLEGFINNLGLASVRTFGGYETMSGAIRSAVSSARETINSAGAVMFGAGNQNNADAADSINQQTDAVKASEGNSETESMEASSPPETSGSRLDENGEKTDTQESNASSQDAEDAEEASSEEGSSGESDASETASEEGETATEAATADAEGETATEAATADAEGEAATEAATADAEGEAATEAATADAEGEAVTEAATADAEGEAATEAATADAEGEAATEAATADAEGEAATEAATADAEGETATETATADAEGETATEAATADAEGETATEAASANAEDETSTTASAANMDDGETASDTKNADHAENDLSNNNAPVTEPEKASGEDAEQSKAREQKSSAGGSQTQDSHNPQSEQAQTDRSIDNQHGNEEQPDGKAEAASSMQGTQTDGETASEKNEQPVSDSSEQPEEMSVSDRSEDTADQMVSEQEGATSDESAAAPMSNENGMEQIGNDTEDDSASIEPVRKNMAGDSEDSTSGETGQDADSSAAQSVQQKAKDEEGRSEAEAFSDGRIVGSEQSAATQTEADGQPISGIAAGATQFASGSTTETGQPATGQNEKGESAADSQAAAEKSTDTNEMPSVKELSSMNHANTAEKQPAPQEPKDGVMRGFVPNDTGNGAYARAIGSGEMRKVSPEHYNSDGTLNENSLHKFDDGTTYAKSENGEMLDVGKSGERTYDANTGHKESSMQPNDKGDMFRTQSGSFAHVETGKDGQPVAADGKYYNSQGRETPSGNYVKTDDGLAKVRTGTTKSGERVPDTYSGGDTYNGSKIQHTPLSAYNADGECVRASNLSEQSEGERFHVPKTGTGVNSVTGFDSNNKPHILSTDTNGNIDTSQGHVEQTGSGLMYHNNRTGTSMPVVKNGDGYQPANRGGVIYAQDTNRNVHAMPTDSNGHVVGGASGYGRVQSERASGISGAFGRKESYIQGPDGSHIPLKRDGDGFVPAKSTVLTNDPKAMQESVGRYTNDVNNRAIDVTPFTDPSTGQVKTGSGVEYCKRDGASFVPCKREEADTVRLTQPGSGIHQYAGYQPQSNTFADGVKTTTNDMQIPTNQRSGYDVRSERSERPQHINPGDTFRGSAYSPSEASKQASPEQMNARVVANVGYHGSVGNNVNSGVCHVPLNLQQSVDGSISGTFQNNPERNVQVLPVGQYPTYAQKAQAGKGQIHGFIRDKANNNRAFVYEPLQKEKEKQHTEGSKRKEYGQDRGQNDRRNGQDYRQNDRRNGQNRRSNDTGRERSGNRENSGKRSDRRDFSRSGKRRS